MGCAGSFLDSPELGQVPLFDDDLCPDHWIESSVNRAEAWRIFDSRATRAPPVDTGRRLCSLANSRRIHGKLFTLPYLFRFVTGRVFIFDFKQKDCRSYHSELCPWFPRSSLRLRQSSSFPLHFGDGGFKRFQFLIAFCPE